MKKFDRNAITCTWWKIVTECIQCLFK